MLSTWPCADTPDSETPPKKLRYACNPCHHAKIKCSRGTPCAGCQASGNRCVYSQSNRAGRPRGTKNKKTLDLMNSKLSKSSSSSSINGDSAKDLNPSTIDSTPVPPTSNPSSLAGQVSLDNVSFALDDCDAFWAFCSFDEFSNDLAHDGSQKGSISLRPGSNPFADESTLNNDIDMDHSSAMSMIDQNGPSNDYFSLPLTPTSSADTNKCSCLQHHAKLLCRLKELWKGSHAPPIDVVLDGVQQALSSWKQFIHCHLCLRGDDEEALLLSAMSFRVVLRLLQRVCSNSGFETCSWSEQNSPGSKQSWVMTGTGMGLRVGNYDITGEERMLVLDLLVSKSLGRIQFALSSLRERSLSKGSRTPPIGSSSGSIDMQMGEGKVDADYVQQLLSSLESSVQHLSRSLRNPHLPSRDSYRDEFLATISDISV